MPTEQDWSEDRALFADGRVAELGPLSSEFVRLAENLLTATTVHGVLDRVVHAARAAVPGADLVSVTLATETGYTTPVYTDDLALKLDEVQYRLSEGPCVDATRTPGLGLTFSGDLAQGVQFPELRPGRGRAGRALRARRRPVPGRREVRGSARSTSTPSRRAASTSSTATSR